MKVEIIQEAGYEAALLGMGLSYGKTSGEYYEDICEGRFYHYEKIRLSEEFISPIEEHVSLFESLEAKAKTLAHKQGGHNKFTEAIMVWIDVTAPLYWWKQADTYRMSTKQSASTMHTIMKRELTLDDFEIPEDLSYTEDVGSLSNFIMRINEYLKCENFNAVNALLPQSFLQRRIWCMSYKTLQNIISQRRTHKLSEWKLFCAEILKQAEHPEFLINKEQEEKSNE